jgi:antirestriction protein ArdC
MSNLSSDIQAVVDTLVARMESGDLPWHKPWANMGGILPLNANTNREYTGVFNPLILMMASASHGDDNRWSGFSQWGKSGNPVKKGEKGTSIYFPNFACSVCGVEAPPWLKVCKNKHPLTGRDARSVRGFQSCVVFNNQQTVKPLPSVEITGVDPSVGYAHAAEAVKACGANLTHGGNRAFYSPGEDSITLPPAGAFKDLSGYWATSLHEHIHWTGHKSRLNREGITMGGFFGSDRYAFEELVAEMGAAFLCMKLGVKHDSLMDNHAAYLQSWVKGLKDDPKALMKAASLAAKGMNFILKADASESE